MDLECSQWHSVGYETQRIETDAIEFGLPVVCKTRSAVAVLCDANPFVAFGDRPVGQVFQTLRSLIKVAERTPQCATKAILPEEDENVRRELVRRQELWATHLGKNFGRKAMNTVSGLGVPSGSFPPPAELKESAVFATTRCSRLVFPPDARQASSARL